MPAAPTPPAATTLDRLEPGGTAIVVRLAASLPEGERRRLMELGFYAGTPVQAVMRSPLGDPVAYRVRGMTIGLRCNQARCIEVRRDG